MAPFVPYTPSVNTMANIDRWAERVSHDVSMTTLNMGSNEQREHMSRLFANAHEVTAETVKTYIDLRFAELVEHYNQDMTLAFANNDAIENRNLSSQAQIDTLKDLVLVMKQTIDKQDDLLAAYKKQLDAIPAGSGAAGARQPKMPDPPTFNGTDSKMSLEDWLNNLTLFCSASGIVTDHQKIVCALARLRSPATVYLKKYFDDNTAGKDLGEWTKFVKELKTIYGQRDNKEGAKDEITALWANKDLAKKDFVKYAEQYRTLARAVEYDNQIHIDKLRAVQPQDMRQALVAFEISGDINNFKWDEYLELLLKTHKAMHPDKAKGIIFGNGNGNGNGSNGNNKPTRGPNDMDIDNVTKKANKEQQANSTEKKKRHCQICAAKGKTYAARSHNTEDCYEYPGNEGKRPAPRQVSTPASGSGSGSGNRAQVPKKKTFKARLMEILNELQDDEDGPETSSGTISINTASVGSIGNPASAGTGTDDRSDDGLRGMTNNGQKINGRYQPNFPEGL